MTRTNRECITTFWTFAPGDVRFGLMENQLIFVPYCCGGFSLVTATIGFIGTKLKDKIGSCVILLYLGSILITLALAIGGTSQAFADRGNVYFYAERQWKAMSIVEEKTLNLICVAVILIQLSHVVALVMA